MRIIIFLFILYSHCVLAFLLGSDRYTVPSINFSTRETALACINSNQTLKAHKTKRYMVYLLSRIFGENDNHEKNVFLESMLEKPLDQTLEYVLKQKNINLKRLEKMYNDKIFHSKAKTLRLSAIRQPANNSQLSQEFEKLLSENKNAQAVWNAHRFKSLAHGNTDRIICTKYPFISLLLGGQQEGMIAKLDTQNPSIDLGGLKVGDCLHAMILCEHYLGDRFNYGDIFETAPSSNSHSSTRGFRLHQNTPPERKRSTFAQDAHNSSIPDNNPEAFQHILNLSRTAFENQPFVSDKSTQELWDIHNATLASYKEEQGPKSKALNSTSENDYITSILKSQLPEKEKQTLINALYPPSTSEILPNTTPEDTTKTPCSNDEATPSEPEENDRHGLQKARIKHFNNLKK